MSARFAHHAETTFGIGAVLAGFGVLTMALFPFALPIVILLAALLIPLLPIAIVGAVVAAAFAGTRAVARRARRRRRPPAQVSAAAPRSRGAGTLLRTPPRWSAE